MTETIELLGRPVLIGAGATVVMDLWAAFLKRGFGVARLDYRLLGRWIGRLPRGRLIHDSIAPPWTHWTTGRPANSPADPLDRRSPRQLFALRKVGDGLKVLP